MVEDGGGLDHLHHEGGPPAGEVVGRTDPAEQPVHHADMRLCGGHVGADLRQKHDDGVLPEKGRLTRHVGTGQDPQPPAVPRKGAIIGDEFAGREYRLDIRVPAAANLQRQRVIDPRPDIVARLRQLR